MQTTKREHGNGERGSACYSADTAGILLELSLPGSLRLGGAGAARRVAAQLLKVRRPRGVAPHADLRGAPLHLEKLPPGRLQAGKTPS